MDTCLMCGSKTFVLFTSVECSNPTCVHYCSDYKAAATQEGQVASTIVDCRSRDDQHALRPESRSMTTTADPRPWTLSTLRRGVDVTWTLALGETVFATRTPLR